MVEKIIFVNPTGVTIKNVKPAINHVYNGFLFCSTGRRTDYFGKSEPPFRQSEPPAEVGWICR